MHWEVSMIKAVKKASVLTASVLLCLSFTACGAKTQSLRNADPAVFDSATAATQTVATSTVAESAQADAPATVNASKLSDNYLVRSGWAGESGKVVPDASEYTVENVTEGEKTFKRVTVNSADALAYFAHEVYADNAAYVGCVVNLTCDVDLENKLWIPIGVDNRKNPKLPYAFQGTFNAVNEATGENHTICGLNGNVFAENLVVVEDTADNNKEKLYIKYGSGENDKAYVPSDGNEFSYGLFGAAANVTVKNLTVLDFTMDLTDLTTTLGGNKLTGDGVGAIIGLACGKVTVENCVVGAPKAEADKEESDIADTRVTGGLIGRAYVAVDANGNFGASGTLNPILFKNCTNYLNVGKQGDPVQKGGIVGFVSGCSKLEFENCKNYGNIVGEIVGGLLSFTQQSPRIEVIRFEKCENYGNIWANDRFCGGLIGSVGTTSDVLKFIDCVNYGDVTSTKNSQNSTGDQVTGGIAGNVLMSTTKEKWGYNADTKKYEAKEYYTTTAFTAKGVYNYGTITGAEKSNESKTVSCYIGGIFGQFQLTPLFDSMQGYDAEWRKYQINPDTYPKPNFPFDVVSIESMVNCGTVTCENFDKVYGTTNQYVGGIFGIVPTVLTPTLNSYMHIDVGVFVNTCGTVNTIDYFGRIQDEIRPETNEVA